jgi:hypothetical protein
MFMDEQRCKVWDEIRQQDSRLLGKHLTTAVLGEAARRSRIGVGKSPLQAANLVWLSILAACFPNKDFASILGSTLKLLARQRWAALNAKANVGSRAASPKGNHVLGRSGRDPSTTHGEMIRR